MAVDDSKIFFYPFEGICAYTSRLRELKARKGLSGYEHAYLEGAIEAANECADMIIEAAEEYDKLLEENKALRETLESLRPF